MTTSYEVANVRRMMHQEKVLPTHVLKSSINSRYLCMSWPSTILACSRDQMAHPIAAQSAARKKALVRRDNRGSRDYPVGDEGSLRSYSAGFLEAEEVIGRKLARRLELAAIGHDRLGPGFLGFDHLAEELVLLRQLRQDLVPRRELRIQDRVRRFVDFDAGFFDLTQVFGIALLPFPRHVG